MQPLNRTLSSIVHGYSKKPETQCICLNKKTYPSNTQKQYTVKVNSRICIKDVDSGEAFTFCIVPPEELDAKNGKISILTSLGAVLIGKSLGDVITWIAPSRLRRFEVQSVFRAT